MNLPSVRDVADRLFRRDPSLFSLPPSTPELTDRMGWLSLPTETALAELERLASHALESRRPKQTLLLGMGGSSLAPELLMKVFGPASGRPSLTVLDTTHPETVARTLDRCPPESTLTLVASKSGTTAETLSLFEIDYHRDRRGERFIALTDSDTSLEKMARERGFFATLSTPSDVGGRYSALTPFGLFPAALLGIPLTPLIQSAGAMAAQCRSGENNPGVELGLWMARLASEGRNKLTLQFSPSLAPFGAWIEQLIAESMGKLGKGILPVINESPEALEASLTQDRLVVVTRFTGDRDPTDPIGTLRATLEQKKIPVRDIRISSLVELGGEFFRWEVATAVAGAGLKINPFDQPNVESAKLKTKAAIAAFEASGKLPELTTLKGSAVEGATLFAPVRTLPEVAHFLDRELGERDAIAIMAYLPYDESIDRALDALRSALARRYSRPVTVGYGPRFLHSTGQLHKGDGNECVALQIVDTPAVDLDVPGRRYGLKTLISAQSLGDAEALIAEKRRVIRFVADRGALPLIHSLTAALGGTDKQ